MTFIIQFFEAALCAFLLGVCLGGVFGWIPAPTASPLLGMGLFFILTFGLVKLFVGGLLRLSK